MSDPKRINKYLSEIGYCSRRAADKLLDEGRITINGELPVHGTKVTDNEKVAVDGRLVKIVNDESLAMKVLISHGMIIQGQLQIWTEDSHTDL